MKVSELTAEDIADYLHIMPDDLDDSEKTLLDGFLGAAKKYVESYTGLSSDEIDKHPDIVPAVCCLAGDFYTNRDMNLSGKTTPNRTVESILGMYCVNLL